uniref:Antibiotic biosynthesis monooxygenase n=1 Tax=Zooxanthella nutricula TaxID=1333877 RepID=A0A7S2PX32_9DINO
MLVIPKVVPPGYEAAEAVWQQEGQGLLEDLIGPGRSAWMHLPAAVAAPGSLPTDGGQEARSKEVTVIVFRARRDLELWRKSNARAEWLQRAPNIRLDVRAVDLPTDYLVSWMVEDAPRRGDRSAARPTGPPPAWVVVMNILLPLYPTTLVTSMLLMPALSAALPCFAALPPPLRVLSAQCLVVPTMVLIGVPSARRLLTAAGLFSDNRLLRARGAAIWLAALLCVVTAAIQLPRALR